MLNEVEILGWVNLNDLVTESLQANPLPVAAGGTGINNMADAIVASGTSGNWTYTKYASGKAECWGNFTIASNSWNQWGGLYETAGSLSPQSYPFTFLAEPSLSVGLRGCSQSTYIAGFEFGTNGTTTKTPYIFALRGTTGPTGSCNFYITIIVKGWWK